MKLLILDNYDSFTYNLVHLIEKVSTIEFEVVRNDQISLEDIQHFDNILLSPGPGLPSTAGIMPELIKHYDSTKSILGICLGLQAIGEAYGATLNNLEKVCHGQATHIQIIEDDVIFKNCPKEFTVGRYHSWVVNKLNLPTSLQITAVDNDGNIMALKHQTHNIRGVQFHPESILSEYGEKVIGNWLNSI
jgi:anthranilate synthase component 2